MATNNGSHDEVFVIEARPSDIESLTTIVARSFHPVNPYIKKTIPDTPGIREWWAKVFTDESNDPSCHVLIAIDPATDKDIGILNFRFFNAGDKDVGFWTTYALPDDINRDMFNAMIDCMVEYREKLMGGRPHYLIELFGAEQGWKGKGVGKKLLKRACEIADQKRVDIFVQANGTAKGFYEKVGGFQCEGELVMPGEGKYEEFMMVRRYGQN